MNALAHLAGPAVTVGTTRRQRCAWCGALIDEHPLLNTHIVALDDGEPPELPSWPEGRWVRIDGPLFEALGEDPPDDACCRHGELGRHLTQSARAVRSWPLLEQRSQAVRGQAPPRHTRALSPSGGEDPHFTKEELEAVHFTLAWHTPCMSDERLALYESFRAKLRASLGTGEEPE